MSRRPLTPPCIPFGTRRFLGLQNVCRCVGVVAFSSPRAIRRFRILSLFRRYPLRVDRFSRLSVFFSAFGYFHLLTPSKVQPFPFGFSPLGTTASADFSQFVVTTASSAARETSPGKNAIFLSIHLPHLQRLIPGNYWTLACLAALSSIVA